MFSTHRLFQLLLAAVFAAAPGFAVESEVGLPSSRDTFRPGEPPRGLQLHLKPMATGLHQPIYVTTPPTERQLYVVERTGCVQLIEHGDTRSTPFLDLRGKVDWAGERGLLGLAFSPDYEKSGRFYVAYGSISRGCQNGRR